MKTSDFDFELPAELIASHPLPQRDASRMLVVGYLPLFEGEWREAPRGSSPQSPLATAPLNKGGKVAQNKIHHHCKLCTVRAQSFAKILRKKMTMYECLLWKNLRNSPMGFSFRKQHPIGKYIVDFINLEHRLIIELDGDGHLENKQVRHDAERDKSLVDSGFRIIRFWNSDVYKKMQIVLDTIFYFLTHDEIPPLQNFYPSEVISSPPSVTLQPPIPQAVRDNIQDCHIRDFINYIQPGDVVVFNNSRVIPARFNASGYEITLHTKKDNYWWGFAKKFNKINIGDELVLDDNETKIKILDKNNDSGLLMKFIFSSNLKPQTSNLFDVLDRVGKMPLPPYMNRAEETDDRERYQTVYAETLGSMAAPTAGLHFTDEMLAEIERRGAKIVNITLHVGAGTWMPVKTEDLSQHKMHSEWGEITAEQAEIINAAKRVIAVGTTSLRLLESAARLTTDDRRLTTFSGTTDIFITPGYRFRVVDVLLTNFHLPKSTLFMLVSAFAGVSEMRAAYQHAVDEKYRFFSYGDCCLLFRKDNV